MPWDAIDRDIGFFISANPPMALALLENPPMALNQSDKSVDLTILMPCLNEAETLALCIAKAKKGLEGAGVTGEILIADNGSTDGSIEIAESLGARVERVREKGYGNALRGGIRAAKGRWILMGDSDDSYDFSAIRGFVRKLEEGNDLVMGCRLPSGGGTIIPGAMPWKNRWIGNPALSTIGRLFFQTPIHDFHCGMRGFSAEGYRRMKLKTTGMEFASEMVVNSTLNGLKVAEVPITLHPDGRSRPPHLKPWRDGWRHLRFMLLYSPDWLFMLPGLALLTAGMLLFLMLLVGPINIDRVTLSTGTMAVAGMMTLLGYQILAQGFYAKVFAVAEGLLPSQPRFNRLFRAWNLERGIALGLALGIAGTSVIGWAVWLWARKNFGTIDPQENLSRLIVGTTLIVLGAQTIFSSFHLSLLGLKTTSRTPPDPSQTQPDSHQNEPSGSASRAGAVLPEGRLSA
jgi:glycosyltransferase involved in cell wall biosynthesis